MKKATTAVILAAAGFLCVRAVTMEEALKPYIESGELPGAISILCDNGARILKEETVKTILGVTSRSHDLSGYSLGLDAPKIDGEDEWIGHGGAWGSNCMVNWHKKQLKLWVVQLCGRPRPWDKARDRAANDFFNAQIDNSGVEAYTGRIGETTNK